MRSFFFLLLNVSFLSCTIHNKPQEAEVVKTNPYDSANNLINEGLLSLKEGDLILRNGQEFSSQFIKNFNRTNKSYSHAGLVLFKDGYPYVYHIVPGDENPDQKLRTDSLTRFCNPRKNFGFAIYRYDMSDAEIKNLRQSVEEWYVKGVAFDSTFNLVTDDRMYCSEMIKKGLTKATGKRIIISTTKPDKTEAQFFSTHLNLPFSYTKNLNVVAIDNLFTNPHCKLIRRFDFNPPK